MYAKVFDQIRRLQKGTAICTPRWDYITSSTGSWGSFFLVVAPRMGQSLVCDIHCKRFQQSILPRLVLASNHAKFSTAQLCVMLTKNYSNQPYTSRLYIGCKSQWTATEVLWHFWSRFISWVTVDRDWHVANITLRNLVPNNEQIVLLQNMSSKFTSAFCLTKFLALSATVC